MRRRHHREAEGEVRRRHHREGEGEVRRRHHREAEGVRPREPALRQRKQASRP